MALPRSRSSLVALGASLALVVTGWGTPVLAQQQASPIELDRVVDQTGARSALPAGVRGQASDDQQRDGGDAEGTGRPEVGPGVVRLESSPTLGAGSATQAARPVKVLKRTGSLWPRQADGVTPTPGQHLDRVEVVQDVTAKRIVVTASYDSPPVATQNSALFVFFGTWDAEEEICTEQVQLGARAHSASATDGAAIYVKDSSSAATSVTRALSGNTLTVTMNGGAAANQGYDCLYGISLDNDSGATQFTGYARDFEAEYEKAPKFDFYSSDLHAAYPGRWNKIIISVRNEGDATARGLKVSASGAKVKFKKKAFKPGNLAPGKRTWVTLKVKLTGKKTRKLKVKAAATGGWSASTSTKVGYRPRPKKVASLSGRSYWANESVDRHGWTVHRLTFVNKSWVYTGSSKLPTCRAKVKGCKKYAYSRKTGALRIGKLRAKVNSEGVKVTKVAKKGDAKLNYQPLKTPRAGSRIAVKLKYTDFNGCGMTFSCSTWWQVLTLRRDGTFTRTYDAIHSSGMPGNQTMISVSGPDPSGTYKLLKKGRIKFSYVDEKTGKRVTETHLIGIDSNVLGKFSPRHGLIVGSDPYL